MMTRNTAILIAILVIGALLRLFSFQANSFTHGNVGENIRAAISFEREGSLKVAGPSREPYWYSTAKYGGQYLDLNAPLMPVISGVIAKIWNIIPTEQAMFTIFKLQSFFAGLLVMFLAYLVTKRLIGELAGIWAAAFIAVSYIMMDYSANGAFYMWQAAIYLGWVLASSYETRTKPFTLGALSGLAWLLNYQAVVVSLATGVMLLFLDGKTWSERLKRATIAGIVCLAVISPLLIRNYVTFGDPLHTNKVNMTYVWNKAGLVPVVQGDVKYYVIGMHELYVVAKGAVFESLPHNAYYMARKLFVLLPIVFVFFAYSLIEQFFGWGSRRMLVPVFLLVMFSLLQMTLWPVVQFRYFVPVLPLILIMGIEYIYRVFSRDTRIRDVILSGAVVCTIAVTFLMYSSNPLHVCYYDCAVTTGPLGRNEELEHLKANGYINE